MSNGHSGRNAMRVDNHIRNNTINTERKIFLSICHSTCSLLTMSWSKFITYLRNSHTSDSHLRKLVAICICRHDDKVNYTSLCPSRSQRCIFEFFLDFHTMHFGVVRGSQDLSNQYFFVFDILSRRNYSICIKFVNVFLKNVDFFTFGFANFSFCSITLSNVFLCFIGSIEGRSVKSSLNGWLIQDDAILLIIACEACHGHNWISSNGHLKNWNMLSWLGCD